jgi:glycosyltransferase involved in cell wall biosynthesis
MLFNPLPTALSHYAEEMTETLGRIGIESSLVIPRPGIDDREVSRVRRIAAYVRAVRAVRAGDRPVLVLWPAIGWLEPLLWRGRKGVTIVVHDPVPLRPERGHGPIIRTAAGKIIARDPDILICHSEESASRTRELLGLKRAPRVCFHPILSLPAKADPEEPVPSASNTVLVAGQYKPTRDVDLLRRIGPQLRATGRTPVILGRGWPRISGWDVTDRFLSESELDQVIASAGAVLLPYQRYWQSGIAVRALEAGVPIVGASTPFLRDLMGDDDSGLVEATGHTEAWLAAVNSALARSKGQSKSARLSYQRKVDESWDVIKRPPYA